MSGKALWLAIGAAACVAMAPRPLPAQFNFQRNADLPDRAFNTQEAGEKIADNVAQIVGNVRQVFVRPFRSTGSSHVGLTKAIADALKKKGFDVKAGADVEIEGRLKRLPFNTEDKVTGFRIEGSVVFPDKNRNFSLDVFNEKEGQVAVGETGENRLPPDVQQAAFKRRLDQGNLLLRKPMIRGTRIYPSPESPYSVEILIETAPGQFVAKTPWIDNGLIYVALKRGDIYAVRVHNVSKYQAAASVYVDGLSRFALSDDPDFRDATSLISSGYYRTLPGWYRDGQAVDSFQVGEYSKSVVAKLLPDSPDVGTIAVSIAAAWKKGTEEPPYEETPRMVAIQRRDPRTGRMVTEYVQQMSAMQHVEPGNATGQGPKRVDPTVKVTDREIGQPRALIKIRYSQAP